MNDKLLYDLDSLIITLNEIEVKGKSVIILSDVIRYVEHMKTKNYLEEDKVIEIGKKKDGDK